MGLRWLAWIPLVGACYAPSYGDGAFKCGPAGECPPGLTCGGDQRCHSHAVVDASSASDASIDAPLAVADASIDAPLAVVDASIDAPVPVIDASIDASSPTIDAPAAPPPRGASFVDCTCADSTRVATCAAIDCAYGAQQQAACQQPCSSHGGYSGSSCFTNDQACVMGFDRVTCNCIDSTVLGACELNADCASSTSRLQSCNAICNHHSGLGSATCGAKNDPACTGPQLMNCTCANRVTIQRCATANCSLGSSQQAACADACAPYGGWSGSSCYDNTPPCVLGHQSLTCNCVDSQSFTVCANVDCANATAKSQMCSGVCSLHSGTASTGACATDTIACP